MIIQHNMPALHAGRIQGVNRRLLNQSMEKLSSGFCINRAAEDAAGLAISEKMRGQIRGLNQAHRNVEDGISLIQTAESAMGEVHGILQRMRELTVQALNETNTEEDMMKCQQEIDQMLDEINRIGNQTEFNTIKVLRGKDMIVSREWEESKTYEVSYTTPDIHAVERITYERGLPDWVICEDKLTPGNPGVSPGTAQVTDERLVTSDGVYDTWTKGLWDNSSAVLDFGYLETLSGEALAGALTELAGTGFYSTCRTCIRCVGLYFTSADRKVSAAFTHSANDMASVDLTDLIASAREGESGAQIADKLIKRMAEAGNSLKHYSRYVQDTADRSKFVIYDWRDNTFNPEIEGEFKELVGKVTTVLRFQEEVPLVIPGQSGTRTVRETHHYRETTDGRPRIQTGANSGQQLLLELPTIDVKELGLLGLSVMDRYTGTIVHDNRYTRTELRSRTYTVRTGTWKTKEYEAPYTEIIQGLDRYGEIQSYTANRTKIIKYTYFEQTEPDKKVTETWQEEVQYGDYWEEYRISALDRIDGAIRQVSGERSRMGAYQNRLEHASLYLGNAKENQQASESRIRDTNLAEEMMRYEKGQILMQAAQSVLAQANQRTEGVMALLQG